MDTENVMKFRYGISYTVCIASTPPYPALILSLIRLSQCGTNRGIAWEFWIRYFHHRLHAHIR